MKAKLIRLTVYIFGFLTFSFGAALSIKSSLGVTATTSLPLSLSIASGLSVGVLMTIIAGFYVLAQILILNNEFKPVNLLQVLCGTVMGLFVDLFSDLLAPFSVTGYAGRAALLLVSIPVIALGLSVVINMKLLPSPAEGFVLALSQKTRAPFPKLKVLVDCLTLALSCVILLMSGERLLDNFREGTVLNALLIGVLIGVFNRLLKPFYAMVLSGGKAAEGVTAKTMI